MTRLQLERRVFWTLGALFCLVCWALLFPLLVRWAVELLLLLYRVA